MKEFSDQQEGQGEEEALPRFIESKPVSGRGPGGTELWKKIVLGLLLLLFFGMILQTFAFTKKTKVVSASAAKIRMPAAAAVPAIARMDMEKSSDDTSRADAEAEGARTSPFSLAPAAVQEDSQTVLGPVLQGILTNAGGEAYAVISEKVVKKGGRVADNVITEIKSNSVVLKKDSGEEWTLRMKS